MLWLIHSNNAVWITHAESEDQARNNFIRINKYFNGPHAPLPEFEVRPQEFENESCILVAVGNRSQVS